MDMFASAEISLRRDYPNDEGWLIIDDFKFDFPKCNKLLTSAMKLLGMANVQTDRGDTCYSPRNLNLNSKSCVTATNHSLMANSSDLAWMPQWRFCQQKIKCRTKPFKEAGEVPAKSGEAATTITTAAPPAFLMHLHLLNCRQQLCNRPSKLQLPHANKSVNS